MFKGIANFAQIMRQAQEMQSRLAELKGQLEKLRATGTAGGGLVTVEATGDMRITSCRIDPSLLSSADLEMTEELVTSAVNQALENARQAAAAEMQSVAGSAPGAAELLSQLGSGN